MKEMKEMKEISERTRNASSGSPTDTLLVRESVNKVRQSTITKGFVQRDGTVVQYKIFFTVDR